MRQDQRALLVRAFEAAVAAAHPRVCLPAHLPPPPQGGRLIVLAAGKAGGSMAAVADAFYRERHRLTADVLTGLAVARHGYGEPAGLIRVVEAGHPVPDAQGLEAAREALELAGAAGPDDLVLVLLSGGGSANWIAPAGAITLADKQGVTRALLRSGAGIGEINTVRKHLSRLKGGQLARRAAPARLLTLAISDVPHDDPAVIASGPTVPDPSTLADAKAILARYGVPLPESVAAVLDDPASETPKPGDPAFARADYRIIARPIDAIEAAAATCRAAGYEAIVLGANLEGEAQAVARQHATLVREAAAAGRQVAIISGGEFTVIVKGNGRGGPNQEYALSLALELDGLPGVAALAGDTDGTDGGGGDASDPAGALIDATTLARATARGLDARAHLDNNDSTGFFEPLGDLLTPGPTRTNVNDCRIILVG